MKEKSNFSFLLKNFCGAFADAAVLLPIIALLCTRCEMNAPALLISAGALYIFAGLFFKVPMAVQPLKSLAVAGAVIGITSLELKTATVIFGAVLMALYIFRIDRILEKAPVHWIRCVQFGLGILLVMQAWPSFGPALIALVVLMVAGPLVLKNFPILGFIAVFAFMGGVLHSTSVQEIVTQSTAIRWNLILSLILPQLVLTSANSVLGTTQVATAYFGPAAGKVNTKNLLKTIGFGNILMGLIGGLPFCHGAGGFTAHVKGGASHFIANFFIGFCLLGLGTVSFLHGHSVPNMNPLLMGALLCSTGIFHMLLAKPLTSTKLGYAHLFISALVILLTKNLLYVILAVIAFDLMTHKVFNIKAAHDSV